MLFENKIVANSPAAGIAAGLAMLAEHYLHMDKGVAAPLATAVVVYAITFVVGYLVKHTNRPDLEAPIEAELGLSPDETVITDAEPEAEAGVEEEATPEVEDEPAEDPDSVEVQVMDEGAEPEAPTAAPAAVAVQPHLVSEGGK